MTGTKPSAARQSAARLRVAIIAARFNSVLVDQLLDGAEREWVAHGGPHERLIVERVPGAFELPLAAKTFAATGRYDAVIALGCVIRGDTPHFDFVAGECARGLMDASLHTGVPVIFGVLTTETQAQAEERASVDRMNKGGESMAAALEMIELLGRNAASRTPSLASGRNAASKPRKAARKRGKR
jgi:6,7-dimethyl-8-ribityllumazine synthase